MSNGTIHQMLTAAQAASQPANIAHARLRRGPEKPVNTRTRYLAPSDSNRAYCKRAFDALIRIERDRYRATRMPATAIRNVKCGSRLSQLRDI